MTSTPRPLHVPEGFVLAEEDLTDAELSENGSASVEDTRPVTP